MNLITCKKCGAEKAEDQMKPRAGKPSKVCIECDGKAAEERERIRKIVADAKGPKGKTRKAKSSATPPPSQAARAGASRDLG